MNRSDLLEPPSVLDIPAEMSRSPLMRQGGFGVYEGLIDKPTVAELLAEAMDCLAYATRCEIHSPAAEDIRGGAPARAFFTAPGGPRQAAIYLTASTLAFLRQLTSSAVVPTGGGGTYSYYLRCGDFLGLHRDIVTCDVAVITCLAVTSSPSGSSGILRLYPRRLREPLSRVRLDPLHDAVDVKLAASQTIVMYGGLVPHELIPLAAAQQRIVSVLCFRVVTSLERQRASLSMRLAESVVA